MTTISPVSGASGVPTNAVMQVVFSKRIDPLTVTNTTFYVYPTSTGIPLPGTVTVTADGLTATLTPNAPLVPRTTYLVVVTNGITDLEGQGLAFADSTFTTQ